MFSRLAKIIPVIKLCRLVTTPSTIVADPFVDLPKYVVPCFEVDTLQEWGEKTSPVEFPII